MIVAPQMRVGSVGSRAACRHRAASPQRESTSDRCVGQFLQPGCRTILHRWFSPHPAPASSRRHPQHAAFRPLLPLPGEWRTFTPPGNCALPGPPKKGPPMRRPRSTRVKAGCPASCGLGNGNPFPPLLHLRLGKGDAEDTVAEYRFRLVRLDFGAERNAPLEAAVVPLAVVLIGLLGTALFLALAAQDHALVHELDVDILLIHAGHFHREHELLVLILQLDVRPARLQHTATPTQRQIEAVPHVIEQAIDFPLEGEERVSIAGLKHGSAIAVPGNELGYAHCNSPPNTLLLLLWCSALAAPPAQVGPGIVPSRGMCHGIQPMFGNSSP